MRSRAPAWPRLGAIAIGLTLGTVVPAQSAESGAVSDACPMPEMDAARVDSDAEPWRIRPGSTLLAHLGNFDAWLDCRSKSTSALPVLFLGHEARPELAAAVDTQTKSLRYRVTFESGKGAGKDNQAWWATARNDGDAPVPVGLGSAILERSSVGQTEGDGANGKGSAHKFEASLVNRWQRIEAWAYIAILALAGGGIAWLSKLLRDRGPLAPNVQDWDRTFSLARTQLFLWTMVVFGVTGVLWIWTGVLPDLNLETLSLLGISAGTTGVAQLIDRRQPAPVQMASRFFVADLINDGTGASVHRLQAVLANFGLASVFTIMSVRHLDFFTIPASWSAMLLMSSGLYLGLKTQEPA
jgi:hypothetical protein